jgi:hypothetical protein
VVGGVAKVVGPFNIINSFLGWVIMYESGGEYGIRGRI